MLLFRLRHFRASLVDPRKVISATGAHRQCTENRERVRLLGFASREGETREAFLSLSKFLFVLSPGDARPSVGEVGIFINSRREGTRGNFDFPGNSARRFEESKLLDSSHRSHGWWRAFGIALAFIFRKMTRRRNCTVREPHRRQTRTLLKDKRAHRTGNLINSQSPSSCDRDPATLYRANMVTSTYLIISTYLLLRWNV